MLAMTIARGLGLSRLLQNRLLRSADATVESVEPNAELVEFRLREFAARCALTELFEDDVIAQKAFG
jgi:hypothetical protein